MKRILTVAATATLVVGTTLLGSPTAAADVLCRGTLSSPVGGTVEVPAGASCTISNTRVDGDVKLKAGASVSLRGTVVDGNVQAESARSVVVSGSTVGGDLQAKYTTVSIQVADTRVNGSIQLEEGRAAITLTGNQVGGDIQLFKNPAGAKSVTGNRIDGNLQCKENSPAPTGSGNVVSGSAENQCRGLIGGNVDVYLTPGTHDINGRLWRTSCEPYSSTKRCRTEIQATTVSYSSGRFVQKTGWVFNNLTYAPIARATWGSNPLAVNARWTSGGRAWRTECDTPTTGRNGCRTYATAQVIERRGNSYQWVNKEILNNMVRFS